MVTTFLKHNIVTKRKTNSKLNYILVIAQTFDENELITDENISKFITKTKEKEVSSKKFS